MALDHMYNPVGRLKTRFSLKEGTCAKALRTLRKPQKIFVVITLLCNYLSIWAFNYNP